MNKIRVIDLLNKIANGEEVPREIIFENYRYHKHPEGYFRSVINSNWIALTTDFNIYDILNDEVEILDIKYLYNDLGNKLIKPFLEEEKKIPEKLEYYDDSIAWVIDGVGQLSDVDKVIIDKINEIIDYLKSKGE